MHAQREREGEREGVYVSHLRPLFTIHALEPRLTATAVFARGENDEPKMFPASLAKPWPPFAFMFMFTPVLS